MGLRACMTLESRAEIKQFNGGFILYDSSLAEKPRPGMFEPEWLGGHGRVEKVSTGGRGDAWFVEYGQHHWVLRRYRLGGLVANFNRRFYLGWRLDGNRAWREWRLLSRLHRLGLPVPRPVAAQVNWPYGRISGFYEAALLVERIPGARTLAQLLRQQPAAETLWRAVGACVADFHRHRVYHADLNANNILLDEGDRIHLIDFDRGAIRVSGDWQQANLQRLRRSLLKLKGLLPAFYFDDNDWRVLLTAYEEASKSP